MLDLDAQYEVIEMSYDQLHLEGTPGCIYLRKSRKDIQAEREALEMGRPFDTLARHQEILMDLVKKYKINVVDVFTEVVSGEFIAEREEFQKALQNVDDGKYRWVAVVDEDRLGRGNKIDQGRIEKAFKDSGTLIVTPHKIVDMDDEADELYMDYKGMGARYEYKQTKKRLSGGRRKSAAEGKFMGARPNYGYLRGIDLKTEYPELIKTYADKAADIENLRLYPHPIEADVVKLIYRSVLNNIGIRTICKMLTGTYLTPSGGKNWARSTITHIVKKKVYKGWIVFGENKHIKQEDGSYLVKPAKPGQAIQNQKAHIPLVSDEEWEAAQKVLAGHTTVSVNSGKQLSNVFAGMLRCGFCGLTMTYQPRYKGTRAPRYTCTNPHCKENRSIVSEKIEQSVLENLELKYLSLNSDPNKEKKSTGKGSIDLFDNKLTSIKDELAVVESQLNEQFDLLERKVYTIELFMQRQNATMERKAALEQELQSIQGAVESRKEKDRLNHQFAPLLASIIQKFRSYDSVEDMNLLLKTVIDEIHYIKPRSAQLHADFTIDVVWKQ